MKKILNRILLCIQTAVLYTSCATDGPTFESVEQGGKLESLPGKGMAIVYFPSSLNGAAARFHVVVDDQPCNDPIFRGEFKTFDLSPGEHKFATHPSMLSKGILKGFDVVTSVAGAPIPGFSLIEEHANSEKLQTTVKVEKGKTYYLKMGIGFARENLKLVSEQEAKSEARGCSWKNPR